MLQRRRILIPERLVIPYITDGCVAMWDGIWNAGICKHSTVNTDLRELIHDERTGTWGGSIDANCYSGVWNTQAAVQFETNFDLSSYTKTTWEFVYRISQLRSTNAGSFMTQGSSSVLETYNNPTTSSTTYYTIRVNNTQTQTSTRVLADNALHTLTMVGNSGTGATLYLDGTLIGTKSNTSAISLTKKQAQCSTGGHVAKIYQFRIYNRILTADEMAANRKVDVNRFSYDAEVQYIESNGTQYINTGIIQKSRNFEVRMIFQWTGTTDSQFESFFAYMTNSGITPRSGFHKYTGFWMFGTNGTNTTSLGVDGNVHELFWTSNATTQEEELYIDGILIGTGTTTIDGISSNTIAFYLGCRNLNGSVDNGASARFMSLNYKVFNDAEHTSIAVEYNFKPVRIGTVGYMFESIQGTMRGNVGTGSFIVGPDKS